MNVRIEAPELCLAAGQLFALDDARGVTIRPREGTVWITEEGEPSDFIVGAGEAFVVARGGRTLVQAMVPARVTLRTSPPRLAANDA